MKIFSQSMSTIETALNQTSLKQKVISQNVANVDTPGYKAKDVKFKDSFESALANNMQTFRTDSRHYELNRQEPNGAEVYAKRGVSFNESGNSVDMDQEMAELAANQIKYNALIDRMSGKFSSLQNVIKGGR
ncbi:flagellar basal-body rod protein FlgB [Cytobacillus horneckiae]|uniref:Flagellar basal body rod protein FlgB n=2 Tax=Cytobacillus horneckiae TaxID=549687 RepID=A0A2N0ZM09_9BACI|nr:flagellar basal body rod protein FlgB [Cytobacillus horneckiae]MBN6887158.1 flagellar basal body rod protein FlgB [Cytobacillus horneckiae]MCM3178251.1 flagellar basal body rod protein FlgB [Cytobacillus horneckiae]MEC1157009.1 flagellar basal body rod protein FlgB [Cytobacillus horneckiae]MED2939965.1 flagellar basal body rod protein FlgB [Cytobacillus horneckiae]PKG30561.1 flagellar basal body rod protein FlgB [Cytobacillus horneckiae]